MNNTKTPKHQNTKTLFLCISEYSGHKSAMDAVIKHLASDPQHPALYTGLNFFNYVPKKIVNAIDNTYYSIIDKKPGIWSFVRDSKTLKQIIRPFEFMFCLSIAIRFYIKVLRQNKYDIIVCTQTFPCVCISILKKIRLIKSKLIAVITDYNINPYWIRQNVDYFIIPHQSLAQELTQKNINPDKIKAFGIPIDKKFIESSNIINDKKNFTALIMGGSLGLRSIEDVTATLKDEPGLDLIVVAGSNKQLEEKLNQEYKNHTNIKILGYVNNIHELMDISDILVCKPGGVTIAEALAKGIKLIITNPIPGQEEKNKDFLVQHNLAHFAPDTKTLYHLIMQEKQKGKYQKHPSAFGLPHAATDLIIFLQDL